jgi:phage FluMu gp28-like protein
MQVLLTIIMAAILPALSIDAPDKKLSRYFLPYQVRWIKDRSSGLIRVNPA